MPDCQCGKNSTSLIQLRGWEAIEGLRGQAFDLLIIDEVAMMRNFWTNWEEVLRPTLTDKKGSVIFISTPKGFNHFYELYNEEAKDENFKSFHFTSFDNPYLPIEELETARSQMTEDRFAQEYLADFRKTEGLVFKEFSRELHVYDKTTEVPRFTEILCGIDFGYTNPACVLPIGKDFDNNYWIFAEWYMTKQTDDQISEATFRFKPNKVYPDPENPLAIEFLKQRGLNVRDVAKGKGSVYNGIQVVRELFKQGKIKISNQCPNLIWELENYAYPESSSQHNENEKPIDKDNHAISALRYALMTDRPTVRKTYPKRVYIPNSSITGY